MKYENMNGYDGSYAEDYTRQDSQNEPRYVKYREAKTERKTGKRIIAVLSALILIAGISGFAYNLGKENSGDTSSVYGSSVTAESVGYSPLTSGNEMTASQVYAANVNSTVGITTQVNLNYFGYRTSAAASGSGIIITGSGYIVTNYHVVENASQIKVTAYDNTSYDAQLIGYDEANDIAVLKISASGLTPVTLGDSDSASVGDEVVAIGNPLGELTFTLTKGIISAKDREVTFSSGVTMNLIQTDAAINSGNSGGALFNMKGELIGITNAKYSSSSSTESSVDNIGFAIPINSVTEIISDIIENGTKSDVNAQSGNDYRGGGYFGYGGFDRSPYSG